MKAKPGKTKARKDRRPDGLVKKHYYIIFLPFIKEDVNKASWHEKQKALTETCPTDVAGAWFSLMLKL